MTAGERSGPSEDAGRTRDSGRAKDATARRTVTVRTRLELRVAKTFVIDLGDRVIEQDYLRVPSHEWPGRPESTHGGWIVLERTEDFVIAQRLIV